MRLNYKTSQHRRDFNAVFECEHCGHQITRTGYDDTYFHTKVIPAMRCPRCQQTAAPDTPTSTPDVPAGVAL